MGFFFIFWTMCYTRQSAIQNYIILWVSPTVISLMFACFLQYTLYILIIVKIKASLKFFIQYIGRPYCVNFDKTILIGLERLSILKRGKTYCILLILWRCEHMPLHVFIIKIRLKNHILPKKVLIVVIILLMPSDPQPRMLLHYVFLVTHWKLLWDHKNLHNYNFFLSRKLKSFHISNNIFKVDKQSKFPNVVLVLSVHIWYKYFVLNLN